MILKVIHYTCVLIGMGVKPHTSFIHQVLSDMNGRRKERLLSRMRQVILCSG